MILLRILFEINQFKLLKNLLNLESELIVIIIINVLYSDIADFEPHLQLFYTIFNVLFYQLIYQLNPN